MCIPPVLPIRALTYRLYSHSALSFTLSPPLLIFFSPPHFSPSSPACRITTGGFKEADQRWRNKKGRRGFCSVIWCSRFDLCLKFIIKSVSITARRAAGYQGQPNALLMRHSETHIHTRTNTHMLLSLCTNRRPATSLPCSPLMNASVVFMAVGMWAGFCTRLLWDQAQLA